MKYLFRCQDDGRCQRNRWFNLVLLFSKLKQSYSMRHIYASGSLVIVAASYSRANRSFESVLLNDSIEFKLRVWN